MRVDCAFPSTFAIVVLARSWVPTSMPRRLRSSAAATTLAVNLGSPHFGVANRHRISTRSTSGAGTSNIGTFVSLETHCVDQMTGNVLDGFVSFNFIEDNLLVGSLSALTWGLCRAPGATAATRGGVDSVVRLHPDWRDRRLRRCGRESAGHRHGSLH